MSTASVKVDIRDRVTVIVIDRQSVRNAIDAETQAALASAFDAFAADERQRVVIITGAGKTAFSAGHDLKSPSPGKGEHLPASGFGGLTARFDLDKPVIGAINGLAFGGGFEMALACDVLVASDNARFALPEVKVGHAALGGGILRLTRAIGHHRAMSMILTGRSIDAHEAFALGLVSEVSAPEALMARALFWAELICANGPLAVRASKRVATSCTELPLQRAVKDQWNVAAVERLLASGESSEGVAAFLEKRAPAWR